MTKIRITTCSHKHWLLVVASNMILLFTVTIIVDTSLIHVSAAAWLSTTTTTLPFTTRYALHLSSSLPSASPLRCTLHSPFGIKSLQQEQQQQSCCYCHHSRIRQKVALEKGKQASIISRSVPITDDWNVTVWEWEKTAAVVETYWQVQQQGLTLTSLSSSLPTPSSHSQQQSVLDPFGLVCWPGAVVAAQELLAYAHTTFLHTHNANSNNNNNTKRNGSTINGNNITNGMRENVIGLHNKRVLILGAGVGIEAQVAATLGAQSVLATDIHPTTLRLLQYGAKQAGFDDIIETRIFDFASLEPLPEADLVIMADVLYNEHLASHVLRRCVEAFKDNGATVLVADSQRFVANLDDKINAKLAQYNISERVQWMPRWLSSFTGSGVLIDADQTYDVKARVLWLGNKRNNKIET